jgi:hypothetical protein
LKISKKRRFTLTDALLKCLKRGRPSEQVLTADVMQLTFVQIGYSTESVAFYSECKQTLIEIIDDDKLEPEVRAGAVRVLGMAVFISNENSTDVIAVLDKLESLFSNSYAKGDGTLRSFAPKVYELHSTALSYWALLLCTLPLQMANRLAQKHIIHFQDFLKSADVDLRIAAGETIALLFELAECDSGADLSCFEDESLLETIKTLANDSVKYRSKKEKKQQRSSFRDILKLIEGGEPEIQTIKFGTESLVLDNWVRRKQYEMFKDLLSTGMNIHLQENEFVREVFELGPPIVVNSATRKATIASMTRLQKAQFNKEQFRNRTKSMNKRRDNKGSATTAGVEEATDF